MWGNACEKQRCEEDGGEVSCLEVKRLRWCRSTSILDVCMVDEHLQGTRMMDERGNTGARALSDLLRRCRPPCTGEVRGATFVRLMVSLVEWVLLYEAEVYMAAAVERNSGQLKTYRCEESF